MTAEVDANGDELFTAPLTEQQKLRETPSEYGSWSREDSGARTYRTTRSGGPHWEDVR